MIKWIIWVKVRLFILANPREFIAYDFVGVYYLIIQYSKNKYRLHIYNTKLRRGRELIGAKKDFTKGLLSFIHKTLRDEY